MKNLHSILLAALLAVTTAFGATAFEAETVEKPDEITETAAACLAQDEETLVMKADGEITLTFDIDAYITVDTGKTEAKYELSDDGEQNYVTITGNGYAGLVTVTADDVTQTVHLYGGTKAKPGLNIYTGTTEALTFEDLGALIADNKLTLSDMAGVTLSEAEGRKAFPINSAFLTGASLKNDRKLYISLEYIGAAGALRICGGNWWQYALIASGNYNRSSWTKWSTTQNCESCGADNHHSTLRIGADNNISTLVSEFNVTPFYKITYMNSDGTVLETTQTLLDANGAVLTAYTPGASAVPKIPETLGESGKVVAFEGWSTEPDGEAMTSIPLDNEDLTLYPVFGEFAFDAMDAASDSKTYTLASFASAGITLESASFDTGYTDATVVFDKNTQTITVTSAGYAGVITATLTDTAGKTYTYDISLFGGTKSKPGFNIYTGTTAPLSIADLRGFIVDGNLKLANIAESPVSVQAGKQAILANRTILKETDFDSGRPLHIAVDYSGLSDGFWFSLPREGWQVHSKVAGGGTYITNTDRWNSYSNAATQGVCENCGNESAIENAHTKISAATSGSYSLYLNNLNIVPYYKITYINGETANEVYALLDASGNFLTAYTPDESLLGAKYYTLQENSDEYFDVTTSIALKHADITLYAYTPDENAPTSKKLTSIRPASSHASAGIRFLSTVSTQTRTIADEYGYIVAREDKLMAVGSVNELKFGADTTYKADNKNFSGTTEKGVKYTGAVNYSKNHSIDIIYDIDAETGDVQFTGVAVGLDGAYTKNGVTYANRYAERFTVRPYVKIGETVYYGTCTTASLAEKAQELIESGYDDEKYRNIVAEAGKIKEV